MPSCTLCYPLTTGILYYPQVIVHIALPDGHGAYDTIRKQYRPVTDTLHYPLATGISHCPTATMNTRLFDGQGYIALSNSHGYTALFTGHGYIALSNSHGYTALFTGHGYTALSNSQGVYCTIRSPHCALLASHNVYCTIRKPRCVLNIPQTTVNIELSTSHSVYCTIGKPPCITLHCTIRNLQCKLHRLCKYHGNSKVKSFPVVGVAYFYFSFCFSWHQHAYCILHIDYIVCHILHILSNHVAIVLEPTAVLHPTYSCDKDAAIPLQQMPLLIPTPHVLQQSVAIYLLQL